MKTIQFWMQNIMIIFFHDKIAKQKISKTYIMVHGSSWFNSAKN